MRRRVAARYVSEGLFSDKKDGSLSKKTESALEFCCRCWCRTKNICSIYHSIKMAGIVHFPPLQLESVCCFSKKKKQNITVRPEEKISLNLKLWDRPVGECLSSLFQFFIILVVIAQLAGWLISISTAKINIALETRHPRNTNATTNRSRLQGCWAERLVDVIFCIF